jgi:threonine aldolase
MKTGSAARPKGEEHPVNQEMEGIDLYSDTHTLPTPRMRDAMRDAVVGDDVSEDDPTVNELERLAAEKVGKRAALFVPSGHMGNLIAAMVHCRHGQEVILEADAHMYYYECGSVAALAGVMPRLVSGRNGIFGADDVRPLLREPNIHYPRTRLLCVENTHNRGGGTVVPLENLRALRALADERRVVMHLDGARVFNAAIALKVNVREITVFFDSVMFCLSKGLSAPVGSMLAGSTGFIAEARRMRKRLGGGMRQAGILAAAGIIALNEMVDRLAEDHTNARALAEGLAGLKGYRVDLETVQTNMVRADISGLGIPSAVFLEKLAAYGIKASGLPPTGVRFVTHRHITRAHIDQVLKVAAGVARG